MTSLRHVSPYHPPSGCRANPRIRAVSGICSSTSAVSLIPAAGPPVTSQQLSLKQASSTGGGRKLLQAQPHSTASTPVSGIERRNYSAAKSRLPSDGNPGLHATRWPSRSDLNMSRCRGRGGGWCWSSATPACKSAALRRSQTEQLDQLLGQPHAELALSGNEQLVSDGGWCTNGQAAFSTPVLPPNATPTSGADANWPANLLAWAGG
ncbi:Uncharacterised protein [Mycolicibacterium phlei]|nr:Uncharacterised protein [Mycolicibacterium phlei]